MRCLTKNELREQIEKGKLGWQIRTGELRDLYSLKLEELPLQKINFRGKLILAISEDYLEKWLIHNSFDIYNLDEYDEGEISNIKTYEEVEEKGIEVDYSALYEFIGSLGFVIVDLHEVQYVKDIDNWSFDNIFEKARLTPEEAGCGNLGHELEDLGSIAFLLENTDPSTVKTKLNHFLYDYNNSL